MGGWCLVVLFIKHLIQQLFNSGRNLLPSSAVFILRKQLIHSDSSERRYRVQPSFLKGLPLRIFLPLNGSVLPIFRHISEAGEKESFVIAVSPLGRSAWPLGIFSTDKDCQNLAAAA